MYIILFIKEFDSVSSVCHKVHVLQEKSHEKSYASSQRNKI